MVLLSCRSLLPAVDPTPSDDSKTNISEKQGVCREAAMSAIREAGFGGDGDSGAGDRGSVNTDGSTILSGRCDGGGQATEEFTEDPPQQKARRRGGATVTMRHLMSAARASAARPGVTREMVRSYDRFASGLG